MAGRREAGYTAGQRRALAAALARGEQPRCPVCGGTLTRHPVEPGAGVPYVRHRVLLVCGACGRGAALDVPHAPGPGPP